MNPELSSSLVAEHTRELTAQADAAARRRSRCPGPGRPPPRPRLPRQLEPGQPGAVGRRPPRTSWAIVISGTRSR